VRVLTALKLVSLLGAALCLSVPPSLLHGQEATSDSAAVAEVIQRFHAALASADSATVLALLADDVVVLESGGLESRSEYRAHHLPADIRFTQAVKSKRGLLRVVVSGDVAWAVSTSEVSGVWRDRAIDSAGAELMVLTREVNGWRIRAIHWSSRPKER